MKTIKTDATIRGPLTHGRTAEKRLADAAPDLLHALKHLAFIYTLTGDHMDGHAGDDCSLCAARAAITKAEEG